MFEDMYGRSILITKKLLACVCIPFIIAGCDAYDVGSSDNDNTLEAKAGDPEVTLSSNFQTVSRGDSVTLSWSSNNISECVASGDWSGTRAISGTWVIDLLTSDSNFDLSCSGAGGTVSDSISIKVTDAAAPTVNLSASSTSVSYGGSTQLSWVSSNATNCAASGSWSGNRNTSGNSNRNNLTTNQTYTISCSGAGGSASDTVSVSVAAPPAPSTPTVNLTASPSNLSYGGATTLSWNSSNTTNCTASGDWSGNLNTSGNSNRNNLTSDKIYTLTCSGAGGSASDTVNVSVAAAPAPTVNLTVSPSTLPFEGSTTLSWSSGNADSCAASGDWSGSRNTSGNSNRNNLTSNKTYTLTCSGDGGSASDTVSVVVAAAPTLPTVNLTASSSSLPYEGSTTLSWSSSNADSCIASGDWSGSRNTSGNSNRNNLTADKTYILTCSGDGGSASDTVNISVAAAPSAPTVNLTASSSSLPYEGSTTLSWSSSNADSCIASGDWSGNQNTSGNSNRNNLTADKTYTLTCSGDGGSASDSVNICVAAPAAPTLSFSASPSTVSMNGSTTLTWDATDVTGCTATGDWSGSKGASGSETINSIMIDRQFGLTCTGINGDVNDTVNVQVVLSNNGTALLSWTPPTENTDNSPLTDLAGYKIYYGTSPGSYNESVTINNPGTSSYLVENLATSDWYFVMTSFNDSGIESSYSTEVSKTIN